MVANLFELEIYFFLFHSSVQLEMSFTCMNVMRGCNNSPDSFCYICWEFTIKSQRRQIIDLVIKVYYLVYFKIKLGDQGKWWTSHMVCKRCEKDLNRGLKERKNLSALKFQKQHGKNEILITYCMTGRNVFLRMS